MFSQFKALIIHSHKEANDQIKAFLEDKGYLCNQVIQFKELEEYYENHSYDCIIIEDEFPRLKTNEFLVQTKLRGQPILIVISDTLSSDYLESLLNAGADDYVTKPFTPMELMARVNSQLRRYRRFMEKLEVRENVHVIGGLEINEDTVEVSIDGKPVKLTPIEYKILLLLAKNPGRVFSAEEIYERVWQEKAINTDTIMVHVRNIREKIELDPKNPKYLKVVWGVGYKIEKQQ